MPPKNILSALQGNSKIDSDLKTSIEGILKETCLAAANGDLDKVVILIEQNKKRMEERNENGRNPLMLAVNQGQEKIVKVLLEHFYADPNQSDNFGNTCLHIAISCITTFYSNKVRLDGNQIMGQIVEVLMKCGGNPAIENKEMMCPFDLHGNYDH